MQEYTKPRRVLRCTDIYLHVITYTHEVFGTPTYLATRVQVRTYILQKTGENGENRIYHSNKILEQREIRRDLLFLPLVPEWRGPVATQES